MNRRSILRAGAGTILAAGLPVARAAGTDAVDVSTIRRKVLCGYQGWFRCPGDPAHQGWVHWSRDSRRITPRTLTFEMWPDMSEYGPEERFAVPGFTYPDGNTAELFSSDNAATVGRHFAWMRDHGIDGAWLQHFVVDLPGGPAQGRYPSRRRVLEHVRAAAKETGRAWALSFDVAGSPRDRVYELLTSEWTRLVDAGVASDPRYLRENGLPVVQVWGFYYENPDIPMTEETAERFVEFFRAPGPYRAFLMAGGDWDWRRKLNDRRRAVFRKFEAYAPWNVANYATDAGGTKHASVAFWDEDRRQCERLGVLWMPVVYPGFGWDNLKGTPAGSSSIPRNGGRFLWEQFVKLAEMKVDCAYVAMFDEVDEGTAIFKVTNRPPTHARFLDYEGLPSDRYLRLVGEGGKLLRGERRPSSEPPIRP